MSTGIRVKLPQSKSPAWVDAEGELVRVSLRFSEAYVTMDAPPRGQDENPAYFSAERLVVTDIGPAWGEPS